MSTASSASSDAAGALKALAKTPLDFLKKYVIDFSPTVGSVPPEYRADGLPYRSGMAWVKLVPTATNRYQIQFVASKNASADKSAEHAFVLAYKRRNRNDDVPFVDIPIKAEKENTFLFTFGLSGCSVIVTRLDNKTYRVFHDRRVDSAVLYNNVHMRVNFHDYRTGGRLEPLYSHSGTALAFMLFQGGEWKLFLQCQLPNPNENHTPPAKWESAVKQAGPVTAEELEKLFNDRRSIFQKRVKANAKNLNVPANLTANAVDGVVVGVEYNEQAIAGWNSLRTAIQNELNRFHPNPNKKGPMDDTYSRFANDNYESQQMDETWIWLQIKKRASRH